jgi:hypothetical protein
VVVSEDEAGGVGVSQSDSTPSLSDGEACPGAGEGGSDAERSDLANAKEKTPMCLVNELARFNKVQSTSPQDSVSL